MKGGEIVRVEGGHIVRATGRKDRHSKVYTAKGPRDRRVRLAAHTAIQFYDVQDRLGYDRPSKAVDWLVKKAESAINKLDEVVVAPPWQTGGCSRTRTPESNPSSSHQQENVCGYDLIHNNNSSNNNNNSLETFFPSSNFAGFDNNPSQASFQAENLGLSLQPFEGTFQRMDSWNGGGGNHTVSRVGVHLNSSQQIFPFSHRELLQSNVAVSSWNQRPSIPTNHHDHVEARGSKSSSLESPFELGFRVPARIYGEDEVENHR